MICILILAGPVSGNNDGGALRQQIQKRLQRGQEKRSLPRHTPLSPKNVRPLLKTPSKIVTPLKSGPKNADMYVIRVLLSRWQSAAALTIACAGVYDIVYLTGNAPLEIKNQQGVLKLSAVKDFVAIEKRPQRAAAIRIVPANGVFSINGKGYRGRLTAIAVNNHLMAVNELDIERYLSGVLPFEISPAWPPAALKSMAIVARTYALNYRLRNRRKWYDLDDTVRAQVYGGLSGEDDRTNAAIDHTRHQVLTYNDKLIEAYFHSNCGGQTADSADIWGGPGRPYLKSVRCPHCVLGGHHTWIHQMTLSALKTRLLSETKNAFFQSPLRRLVPMQTAKCGRILKIQLTNAAGRQLVMKTSDLRRAVGYNTIKSIRFKLRQSGGDVIFDGHGHGHGVGYCQWGANGMARKNAGHLDILYFYFSGVRVQKFRRGKEW